MKRPLQIYRLLYINNILLKNRLDRIVLANEALQQYSFISYFNPWHWLSREEKPRGESIRLALEQLGPLFVKFGQILSTRRDLLPDDVADELEKLQDKVSPFPGEIAKEILEKNYKKPLQEIFAHFDIVPLASASIAQVHAATLKNGKKVIIKILRPNIKQLIVRDISLLYSVATITEKLLPYGKRLRPRAMVAEFEHSIIYELDLLHEGANASLLRRNFLNSPLLYVPEVHWDYSNKNILVMERIDGIPISDIPTLQNYGINLKNLAEKGVEIFFTQVLRDRFFHADMHPGNIFVSKNEVNPKYIAVDFGIMGTLSPNDQRYLAENLLAFFHRDYRKLAEIHITANSEVRIDEFETAIRGVCEPIFDKPLKDISFGKLLLSILQAARNFHLEVQPQFFLLQKTLINVEGLGRQLYPELNLWTTAKPYLEKWVRQQMNPRKLIKKIYQQTPTWIEKILDLPDFITHTLTQQQQEKELLINLQLQQATKNLQRKKWLGLGAGLTIMAALNYFLFQTATANQLTINLSLAIIGLIIILFNF